MRRLVVHVASLAMIAGLAAAPARAADVKGVWLRDTGASKVKFSPCGGAICGHIVWLKPGADPKARIGQRVFFDMKPSGANSWSGSAFNPQDGKTYTGKMTLDGNTLTTAGCVMGIICKSTNWTRSK
ncbi:MAG: DUF2147 domain-containing protein [Xanthobacteraceae bacterium]|nr:DUF2147 domain-containing protein [Xanthobacteraceae bacterium]